MGRKLLSRKASAESGLIEGQTLAAEAYTYLSRLRSSVFLRLVLVSNGRE